jgi:uncharacterized protein
MAQPVKRFMPSHSSPKRARHRMSAIILATLLALLCCLGGQPSRAQTVEQVAPQVKASGYVTDLAGVLSQSGREQLTALCTEVDQKTQAQIAVVTIKTLGGRPVEDYSVDLATRLGIGPKNSDRGVLILFAIEDRQIRVETGYGLEPILPDGKTGGFQREIVPLLRGANYDAAILLITRRVADVIAADRGVTLTGSSPPPPDEERGAPRIPPIVIPLIIFFIFFLLRSAGRGGRGGGWWIGPMIGGAMGGGWGGGGFGGGGGGGGGFGGFGGGGFGGGGSSGSW